MNKKDPKVLVLVVIALVAALSVAILLAAKPPEIKTEQAADCNRLATEISRLIESKKDCSKSSDCKWIKSFSICGDYVNKDENISDIKTLLDEYNRNCQIASCGMGGGYGACLDGKCVEGRCGDKICSEGEDCPNDCKNENDVIAAEYEKLVNKCRDIEDIQVCINASPIASEYKNWCEAQGGRYDYIGLHPAKWCNLPTSDGGKECTDSSQCESMCLSETDYGPGAKFPITGVTGKCATWRIVTGCLAEVVNGSVEYVICID